MGYNDKFYMFLVALVSVEEHHIALYKDVCVFLVWELVPIHWAGNSILCC